MLMPHHDTYIGNVTVAPQRPQKPTWHAQLKELVERNRKNDGRNGIEKEWAVCIRLAPMLSEEGKMQSSPWSPNYLLSLLHETIKDVPSPVFRDAVEYLLTHRKPRIRKVTHRVYTAFDSSDDARLVTQVPASDRRDALLKLAREEKG